MWGQPLFQGKIETLYHGANKIPDVADFESIYNNYCSKMLYIGSTLVKTFQRIFQLDDLR